MKCKKHKTLLTAHENTFFVNEVKIYKRKVFLRKEEKIEKVWICDLCYQETSARVREHLSELADSIKRELTRRGIDISSLKHGNPIWLTPKICITWEMVEFGAVDKIIYALQQANKI